MRAEPHRTLCDRYHLLAEIGRGGMGRVWRAHDARLNRTVAVKEILLGPGLDEDERDRVAARAKREARATAMGGHRNIVTVHDIIEDDGRPWIVMEFLTGHSLRKVVRERGPLDARVIAGWGLDLLSALSTAHGQGIIHRDVKPENVMVTDAGQVVLTDFGIATIADATALTQTGGMVGSAAYLAPERLASSPATSASDLWSLGATLSYAATGVSPFRRETVSATLHAITVEEPAGLSGHGPLNEAVRGLLVKDPARRIDAARCRVLLRAAAGEGTGTGTAVPPPPAGSRPSPGQPRGGGRLSWPVVVLTLGLASLVAAAALLVAFDPREGGSGTTAAASGAGEGEGAESTGGGQESAGEGGEDGDVPSMGGMTWTRDPQGFGILVPADWIRRVDGSAVFYDSPTDGSYLQVDLAQHPTDDEYQHVLAQEENVRASGRMPGYERLRVEDVTGSTGFHSAAEWEFTWNGDGRARHLLARNITVAPGTYYTIAWVSPEPSWAFLEEERVAALDSFAPA
ncbi:MULTISPECIES: serine/threonine-protein kinase [Nocardiopsis]|uniref:non-specific serine/threonine protein kinase n=1 Tax=Nocardiopsis sinuspersici TaxID=501010 RepID=A0A1V3C0G2_9ACTN|nr:MULTISPECIES: serine/threonine-protein kinase [Nocardiopsis]OOC53850.1 serine/threonine protein kinase [Nocardiopsis sinuspersici]